MPANLPRNGSGLPSWVSGYPPCLSLLVLDLGSHMQGLFVLIVRVATESVLRQQILYSQPSILHLSPVQKCSESHWCQITGGPESLHEGKQVLFKSKLNT